MFSNILFDLDGTLTDSKDGITRSIHHALNQLGVQSPGVDQLDWCVGPPIRESFGTLLRSEDGSLVDKAIFHFRSRFSTVGMFENQVYPGVYSFFQNIQQEEVRIFLATSKPEVFATQILDHFGLSQFFNAVYGSELNGNLSDKGELVAHILDSENLAPQQTVIVGDRHHDIIGGKKNEIMTAGVSYGYGTREELISSKPDFIFDAISDLEVLLRSCKSPETY